MPLAFCYASPRLFFFAKAKSVGYLFFRAT